MAPNKKLKEQKKVKLLRVTTVSGSLRILLKGQQSFMTRNGFEVVGVSSQGDSLKLVAEEEGIRVEAIEMTRTIALVKDFKALWLFYKLCKRENPIIVHSHTPKAGIIAMLGAKLAGIPIRLHTVAGLPLMEATGKKRKLLDFVEKLTYACANKVYPNSKGLYDFILEQGYTKPEKLKMIGYGSSNGIDTTEFDPLIVTENTKNQIRHELAIDPDDFVFLFVGRVVTDKGVNELVEAFQELMDEDIKSAHLVIVGRYENNLDPLKPQTDRAINNHPNIHAVGYKTNVAEYFAMADALTFPSYREGFPNVVMQAAAMELIAIVSDINGCNEIITDGKNGWVVPVKDVRKLKDKMRWCLKHKKESTSMGQYSRVLMQKKFERQFVWQKLLKEYRKLLRNRR